MLVEFACDLGAMDNEPIRTEYERATIKAFVVKERQERFLYLLGNPKRRKKFLDELGHFRWSEKRFTKPVKRKVDPTLSLWGRHLQGINDIAALLRSRGAGKTCWVISERAAIDGKELELEAALGEVVGNNAGVILSCVPGKLAYFEGEDESLLLAKTIRSTDHAASPESR